MMKGKWESIVKTVKRRKKTAAAVCVLAVVIAAIIVGKIGKGGGHGGMPQGMGMQQENNMSSVRAVKPEQGSIVITTGLTGTVEPSDVVHIYAKAGGDVTSVEVKAGDTVQAGQLICTIDTDQVDTAKNSMDSAAVSLSEAQSNLNRMQILYSGGDISDQEWEQYQNQVKTAKLQYESAKLSYEKQVEYSSITAPISGRVESCDIEVHDTVSQSTELCVISGEGDKRVSFYVTEDVMENLKLGDAIEVEKNGTRYEGTISDVSSMVDSSTGLFKVKAELPEVNTIATGSVVKVFAVSEKAENVMTVPVDAIYYDGGVGNVYVYEDGTIHKKEVEVGIYDSELAEIRSGLDADELVVSTWSSELYEGSVVKLKNETEDGGEDTAMAVGELENEIEQAADTEQNPKAQQAAAKQDSRRK